MAPLPTKPVPACGSKVTAADAAAMDKVRSAVATAEAPASFFMGHPAVASRVIRGGS